MSLQFPLETMTVSEKLLALETIWASLCDKPLDFNSPDWHRDVLAERKQRLASGHATVSDWETAKQRFLELGQ